MKAVLNGDATKVSYYLGAVEQQGVEVANRKTHKRFLRKHKLGKFKKK